MTTKKPSWKVYIRTKPSKYYGNEPLGSMAGYVDAYNADEYEEREPFEFVDRLELADYYRGRSAAGFNFTGSNGAHYIIRISEMVKLIKATHMVNGMVTGRWGFVKQGANYSLTYLGAQ